MATNTNNYGFKKPEENDFYSIEDQNRNWDLVDTKMAQLNSDLADHFPHSKTIQSASTSIFPRVSVFEYNGMLYLRLTIAPSTYRELYLTENDVRIAKVVDNVIISHKIIASFN